MPPLSFPQFDVFRLRAAPDVGHSRCWTAVADCFAGLLVGDAHASKASGSFKLGRVSQVHPVPPVDPAPSAPKTAWADEEEGRSFRGDSAAVNTGSASGSAVEEVTAAQDGEGLLVGAKWPTAKTVE